MRRDIGADVLVAARAVDIDDAGVAIVDADGQFRRQLAVHLLLGIHVAVPEDIRQAAIETELGQFQRLQFEIVRACARCAETIAVDMDGLRIGIEILGGGKVGISGAEVAADDDVGRAVIANVVVEDLDLVVGVDQYAGTGRDTGYRRALVAEVVVIVAFDLVAIDPRGMPRLRQIGHVEYQDAAGIAGGDIVVDVGTDGVLDLDTRNVALGTAVAHHHVARLPDIDAGVRGTDGHHAVDQHILGLHRVDAVGTILGSWAVGPLGTHATDDDVLAAHDL